MREIKTKGQSKKTAVVEINREWCKGCGICIAFCPKEALKLDEHEKACWFKPENCIGCGACELRCPDMAIEVKKEQGGPEQGNP